MFKNILPIQIFVPQPYSLPVFRKSLQRMEGPAEFLRYPGAEYAKNFFVPTGTSVFPVREGIVIEVKEGPDIPDHTALTLQDAHRTNSITLQHHDNSFSHYIHIIPCVQIGDVVGLSDSLGTSGRHDPYFEAHIHVNIYRQNGVKVESIDAVFEDAD